MSLSLLKQSLDILEQDSKPKTSKAADTSAVNKQTLQKNANKTRASVSKQTGPRNKQSKKIGDIKEEINYNKQKSKENLRKLLAFSKNTLKNVDAEKIVKHAHKGRYVEMNKAKSNQEVESIFTDEDFRAFEEEYFKS